jgi:transposase
MIRRGFLDAESRKDLAELARDGSAAHRLARRANALVLLDDGMSCEAIAKVLLLDDDTIRTWYRLYQEDGIEGLASFGYEGGACRLSEAQQDKLKAWITETLPRTTREVGAWIETECGIEYQGPVWPDRAVAPPWHGTSQTKDGVAQARSREAGGVHQGV